MSSSQLFLWRRWAIVGLGLVLGFTALAKSAHDIWAATATYLFVLMGIMACVQLKHASLKIPLIAPTSAVIGALALSFFFSSNPSESFLGFMDWMALIGVFFLAVNLVEQEDDLTILAACLVPIFWIEFSMMFHQWLKIGFLVRREIITYEEPVGTFISANSYVAFALMWLPLFIQKVINDFKNRKRLWFWLTGLISLLFTLILVSSTWSVVCLVLGGVVWVGQSRIKKIFKSHPQLFFLFAAVVLSVMGFLFWNKLAIIFGWGGVGPDRVVPTNRFEWWEAGFRMWRDRPWTGVGIGNFPSAYLSYKVGAGQSTLYAHGLFIQLLSETGLLGFGAITCFLGIGVWKTVPSQLKMFNSLRIGLILFVLYSLIHVSFEYLSNLFAVGLVLGALVSRSTSQFIPPIRWSIRVTVIVVGLAVIPYLVAPFFSSRHLVDGQAYLNQRNWDEAEKSFQNAIVLDNRPWEPYWGLSQVALARKNENMALDMAREALNRNRMSLHLKKTVEKLTNFSGKPT